MNDLYNDGNKIHSLRNMAHGLLSLLYLFGFYWWSGACVALGQVWTPCNGDLRRSPSWHDSYELVRLLHSPGVGVTKVLFVISSGSKIFNLAEVPVRFLESHLYFDRCPRSWAAATPAKDKHDIQKL